MFGVYSYIFSILFFAGIIVIVSWIFGFHILKRYLRVLLITIIFALIFTLTESAAFAWNAWGYSPDKSFNFKIFGAEAETYIFSIFISLAIAQLVIVWTFYEDKGKSILLQSIKDVLKGTYAFWKREVKIS